MQRAMLGSLFALFVLPLALNAAEDKQNNADKKQPRYWQAKISKVDADDHKITVTMMNQDGDKNGNQKQTDKQKQTKTLELADDAKILNAAGKKTKLDSFKSGDDVVIRQKNGKVTELREQAEATITNVDEKKGTVTVQMTDENGKEVKKTFRLVEESEYIDSTGEVAVLDVFRSGDMVLFIEADGQIQCMKKQDEKTASKDKKNSKEK